ncbi:MAG: NifB/NifX family molybdenum-iron cluster-binding protein [Bacillota bacterium]|nr:NifB/NifX family molybdenum-iron cluster-binding protein [Bacillota bacterium]
MGYRIAAASTDGIHLDQHFGSAGSFLIFEVEKDSSYKIIEERIVPILNLDEIEPIINPDTSNSSSCSSGCTGSNSSSCKSGDSSSCGSGGGCGGGHSDSKIDIRVSLIFDCRCLICSNIGPSAERQLERKSVTPFGVDGLLKEALDKIIGYYSRIDKNISLRRNK